MKTKIVDLVESTDLSESLGGAQIDEANGVLKNVVLMTGNKTSENKTRYSAKAVQEGLTRYEGAKMYLDHPRVDELKERRGNRSVRDLAGVYRNLHVEEGPNPKLRGDLQLMESMKSIVISIAKNPPKGTGLSLRDRGFYRSENGVTLVDGFEEGVDFSVDLVTRASLNKSLFESVQEGGGDETMDLSKLTVEDLKKDRKDLVESIQEEAKKEARTELAKQLEEAGVKSLEASKLVALAESGMPVDFKEVIRPAIMKAEVTLEEAKKLIVLQESLAGKVGKPAEKKEAGNGDPKVKSQGTRQVEEGVTEPTDEEVLAAFGKK
jgi:hypothetical protein